METETGRNLSEISDIGGADMKYILIASLLMAAGRYTDMPIWEMVVCGIFAYSGAALIKKIEEEDVS